ncbi:cAMP-binding domain of CRP [Proteiniphilum saccharofermentans]|uniref:cAMP-binding domain of CRP n=1 Tax=Proteiniphilum saccharofermentans TaxID=1642647 RepID=A0A1R3T5N3_9BACT|nr:MULTISPECIES: Crp/Fnr family transcriptional regulator [Proteiniphilum]SCD20588.1 cAMP-binding domain of CRP [Proteiniphilum saccharofermentans]SEA34451.1 CRP/FNR family transcriptional regulator, anaerobic regulatory protein [Porphyromonadaceae bacterium KH3R12]SFK79267.1 CRP/FNR family transcriptional regulator, anaerobic regulatory protein [Porphyromonadaceae bacterium KH3CP3RA]SFS35031.1 CRP/FNR family transcriptional regulator, anaerobic regulatory protein [Porphyromonadaceae bacterium 
MKTILENDNNFVCDIQAPCFQMLTPEEVELVQKSKTQVLFRKGDNLTKQGAFASYVLFVIDGMVKQYMEGEGNKSFNLRIIRPGEFVGLSSVFLRNTFNYSSVALTDCRAFLVEKDAIAGVVKQNGMFGFNIIKRYCEQNADLLETLHTVIYNQINGRMAKALLYIDGFKKDYPEIFLLLSRKDIANFAGTSVESAVKLLKNFEKDGLIQLNEKDILIINYEALAEISKRG